MELFNSVDPEEVKITGIRAKVIDFFTKLVYNGFNSQGGPVYREIPLFTGENRKPGSRGFPCIQVKGKFSIANLEQ